MADIIIFSGFAGSGKGTVFDLAKEKHPTLWKSVSMTTRAPRPGEVEGLHYFFVSKEEFSKTLREDGFLEHAEYCGNCYGTPRKKLFEMQEKGFVPVLEIETVGAEQAMARLDRFRSVFIAPPNFKTLEARLRGRGTETESAVQKRLTAAKEELEKLRLYEFVLVNRDGAAAETAEVLWEVIETGKTHSSLLVQDKEAFISQFFE